MSLDDKYVKDNNLQHAIVDAKFLAGYENYSL